MTTKISYWVNLSVGENQSIARLVIVLITILAFLYIVYSIINHYGWIDVITDPSLLRTKVLNVGVAGVFLIIGLMSIAIILNPIPSAPIALVSGALYGHTWGTIYIVIGAQIGAMVAFMLSRFGGRELIFRIIGNHRMPVWIGTQNILTTFVFVSRLIPFISFDLVSYAAGLTKIKLWRFSVATLLGLLPASFLLAHFGSEVSMTDLDEAITYVLLIGLIVLLPTLVGIIKYVQHVRDKKIA